MFLTRPVYACRSELNVPSILCYCLFVTSLLTGIVCQGEYDSSEENLPTSGLCRTNTSATCSHQVASFNVSDGACKMFFHKSASGSCSDEHFTGEVDADYNFSHFSLLTYLYKEEGFLRVPAFNLTFSHIKWISMKMRFKENESSGVKICREFHLSPDAVPDFYFYFDCLWNNATYQNKPYIFQYQISTKSGDTYLYKYFFKVPDSTKMDEDRTSIGEWEVFSLVDMTDGASRLSLTVQAVPVSFNVTIYKIQVLYFKDKEDEKRALHSKNDWTVLNRTITGENDVIRQLWDNTWVLKVNKVSHDPHVPSFTYSYDTRARPGIYRFTVEFEHPECGQQCYVSETPSIVIVDLPARGTLVMFVGAVILIPVCLTLYFLWKRRCETAPPTPDPTLPPKFLLIYNPVSVEHINSMVEMAKYFNKVCHLQAMIDVLGIPQSEHKDPMRWYIDSFNEADFVGIFPSPTNVSSEKDAVMKTLIYSNTNTIAQAQLRQRLCSPGAKCKFFGVALPNACWDTLPDEAQALKRYTLPRDLDPLLVLIGVVPQCDQGKGFTEALANAHPERDTLVLTLNGTVNSAPGPSAQSSPTPTPVTCCAALSTSDPDLISTSQQVTSCMSTAGSSDDQLSLLGNY